MEYTVKEPDLNADGTQKRDANGKPLFIRRAVEARYTDGSRVRNTVLKSACVAYFSRLKERLGARHTIGVYGNGFAADLLDAQKTIQYVWLSGSLGFENAVKRLKSNAWHLFQNNLDRKWFVAPTACGGGLDVDTNMQNPAHADFGAWSRNGLFRVESTRTAAVAGARLFAVTDVPIVAAPGSSEPPTIKTCTGQHACVQAWVRRNRNVRLLGTDSNGDWLQIDLDEDGSPDGFCPAAIEGHQSFVSDPRLMPDWTGQDEAKKPVCD